MSEAITPEEAEERMDDGWAYLDVRSIPEFEGGHPTGAYNVPLKHLENGQMVDNPDFLRVVEASFPKDAKLIVACKAGGRSKAAVAKLEAAGFTQLADQVNGFDGKRGTFGEMLEPGWQPTGLPVSAEPEPGHDYASLAAKAG
ncbi:MAG: rhodanese-like domain-containing protein [Myxococcota bacterium]